MILATHLPILPVVIPLLAAPLLALVRRAGAARALATVASLGALAVAVLLAQRSLSGGPMVYYMGGWLPPYGIELHIDSLGALMLLIITGASSLSLISARHSLAADVEPAGQPLYFAAWLLALGGLSGIVVAGDAFNIFVFMEISSLATYILVAGGADRRALPATFKYLIMGTLGATLYLIGIGLLYMVTGTLNITDLQARLGEAATLTPTLAAAGAITVGLALKSAVFPLHAWLPNAYTYAPNAATAFIAACSTKVSLYVLLRINFAVLAPNLGEQGELFGLFLAPLAVLAMIVAAGSALFESNLKRMLAWSSVSQMGYIVLGASLSSLAGLTAATLHVFNHAVIKGTLFLGVAALGQRYAGLSLQELSGAGRQMPWTFAAFTIAALSLIGIPGTAGFISKWYLVLAALEQSPLGIGLAVAILVNSLLALAYIGRVLERAYFGAPAAATTRIREAPASALAAVWIGALANLYFGLFPQLPLALARRAAEALVGTP